MKYKATGKITHTVELTGEDIMGMMCELGTRYTPAQDATIQFRAPGLSEVVDFKKEPRVIVSWTVTADINED